MRRHVDPPDPLLRFLRRVGDRVAAVAPARDQARGFAGTIGHLRELLAALREVRQLAREPVERRGETVERFREAAPRQRDVARELAGHVAGRQAQLADRRRQVGRRVGQVGHVAGRRARRDLGVARQFPELAGGDLLAEEQRRGVRQLVRLVEDDRVAVGQQLGHAFVAQHHVGEEQVVVDDDDVGIERVLARLQHEARGVMRAVLPQAVVARRRDQRPDRGVLGHVGEFGAVAALGRTRERDDLRQVANVVARRQQVFARGALEVVVADVVRAPLQQRDRHRRRERVAHEREVALEQLVLQRLGARRDDDLAAVQEGGHDVRERLAGAGAGFRDELAALGDGPRDRLRHRELLRAETESRKRARERPAVAEDGVERGVVGRTRCRGRRDGRRGGGRGAGEAQFAFAVVAGLALAFAPGFGAAFAATAVPAAAGAVENATRTLSILNDISSYARTTRSS